MLFLFFFKEKTAYEIPKRDWSSDVCSSDLRMFCCQFAHPAGSRDSSRIDQIDYAAEFPYRLDLYPCGVRGHDDGTTLAQNLASAGQGLTKVATRRGDDVLLRNRAGEVARGAKFKAASVLKGLARNRDGSAQAPRQARGLKDRGGPDNGGRAWLHASRIRIRPSPARTRHLLSTPLCNRQPAFLMNHQFSFWSGGRARHSVRAATVQRTLEM